MRTEDSIDYGLGLVRVEPHFVGPEEYINGRVRYIESSPDCMYKPGDIKEVEASD